MLGSNALTLGVSGSGSLVKNGAATLTLGGANTFTGGLAVNAGTVALVAAWRRPARPPGAGSALDISLVATRPSVHCPVWRAAPWRCSTSLTFGDATNQTFAGVIGGTGGLIKQGTGVQTLTGASTFSGGVNLAAGGLVLGNAGALGSGALTVSGNGSLDATAALNLGNAINLGAALNLPGSQDLTLGGNITGTGSLVKNGASTLTLNGTNTFSGGLNANAGSLLRQQRRARYWSTGHRRQRHARWQRPVEPDQQCRLGAGAALSLPGSQAITLGGVVSGTGRLVKNGASTLTLNGANSFGGGLTVNGGGVFLGNAGALGTALSVGATATLDSSAALNLANNVNLGAGAALDLLGSQDVSLGGLISGTGSLVKNGTATLALNGPNTFSGVSASTRACCSWAMRRHWVPASWTWAVTLRWMQRLHSP